MVGGREISGGAVRHWMALLAPEHRVPDQPRYVRCIAQGRRGAPQAPEASLEAECREQYETLKARALNLLITWEWLIGENEAGGATVPARAPQPTVGSHEPPFPDSTSTAGDMSLVARAEAAASAIRAAVTRRVPPVTPLQVASFYHQHLQRFEHGEQRTFDIIERLSGAAVARQLMRRILSGRRVSNYVIHERRERPHSSANERPIERAIFGSRRGVLVGPLPLNHQLAIFKVTRIDPAHLQPLAEVARAIRAHLTDQRRRAAFAQFIDAWRARWTALTTCDAGYLVTQCRQYRGVEAPVDPFTLAVIPDGVRRAYLQG
jgi:hypothetical protein